jgi:hypothetical protein
VIMSHSSAPHRAFTLDTGAVCATRREADFARGRVSAEMKAPQRRKRPGL